MDVKAVAAGADSPATAAEIYLISRTIINMDNDQERSYMAELATELKLAPDLVAKLENHFKA